jgi:hypothetical protein
MIYAISTVASSSRLSGLLQNFPRMISALILSQSPALWVCTSGEGVARPAGGFNKKMNYERTDFGLADDRERRLNHPEFKTNTYQPEVYKNE